MVGVKFTITSPEKLFTHTWFNCTYQFTKDVYTKSLTAGKAFDAITQKRNGAMRKRR